jgi:glutamyl-tRNA reductase
MKRAVLDSFHIIAFTHRQLEVNQIGMLHIDGNDQKQRLQTVKSVLAIDELLFLSTCNRVEFLFTTQQLINDEFISQFISTLYPHIEDTKKSVFTSNNEVYSGEEAVNHLFSVASSIDSMIVGEREIITQVRGAYDQSNEQGLTGDFLRILIKHTIETAKRVYTETSIATKPVSVVSLAYHKLKLNKLPLDTRIVIVGAGMTNTNLCRFLKKHGFSNFTVFNRTVSKAEQLAKEIKGKALPLSELQQYAEGFDVLLTCTGTDHHLIGLPLYEHLLQQESTSKIVIDLAIPQDLHPDIIEKYPVNYISVDVLQKESNQNLKERSKEIQHVEEILADALTTFNYIVKERSVELAMREVPKQVKEIKSTAMNEVFKLEIESMDDYSKEILEKVLGYMEKKYISGPMKLAKDILIKNT